MAPTKTLSEIRFEGFPDVTKGLHWLRWIDGVDVRGRGTGSAIIHAYLSAMPSLKTGERLPSIQELYNFQSSRPFPMHVGMLSTLRLGTVFSGGRAVGWLNMPSRSFKFPRNVTNRSVLRVLDENPAKKPDWWKFAWSSLPQKVYPLNGLLDSYCLILTSDMAQLILPSSEVFRVFCAPESLLADTLLSGPWDVVRSKVINESWCDKHKDYWELGLRAGLTGLSTLPIAAFEMTDLGRSIAGFMFSKLIGGSSEKRKLYSDIPYEWDEIEIDVQGIPFSTRDKHDTGLDRFLGLRIIGVRFPKPLRDFPNRLFYRLDNYNTLRSGGEEDEAPKKIFPAYRAPLPDDSAGTILVTSSEQASALSEPLNLGVLGTPFDGGPVVERMELTVPDTEAQYRNASFDAGFLHSVSATPSRHTSAESSPLHPIAGIEGQSGDSFGQLTKALDTILGNQQILDWNSIAPEDDKFEFRNGHPVWLFPVLKDNRRKAWSYISSSKRRSAIAIRVRMSKDTFHLIDIERRFWESGIPREGFSLLLLKVPQENLQRAISALLRESVEWDGVWAKTVKASSIRAFLKDYLIRNHPSSKRLPEGASRQSAWNVGLLAIFNRFLKS